MKRKYGIFIGAVAVVLLMVSSATAVTNHVEPGIHISVIQKGILRAALKDVDDPNVRILLQEIIKKKGPVDSSDIEQIISDNPDIEVGTVTSGPIYGSSGGTVMSTRRPFCYLVPVFLPVLGIKWDAWSQHYGNQNNDVDLYIAGEPITYDNHGYAILYVGYVVNGIIMNFQLDGRAVLIVYNPTIYEYL